jgi:hypothetical protein
VLFPSGFPISSLCVFLYCPFVLHTRPSHPPSEGMRAQTALELRTFLHFTSLSRQCQAISTPWALPMKIASCQSVTWLCSAFSFVPFPDWMWRRRSAGVWRYEDS